MEPFNISQQAFNDYCYEDESGNGPSIRSCHPRRLLQGIDLKDLCDGREVIFDISEAAEKYMDRERDTFDEMVNFDSKLQRENRGAPPPNCSFKSIAKKMQNVTEDGLVKKQIITYGSGEIVPHDAFVIVHYNLYKEHCEVPFDSTYLRGRPEKFRLDLGEAIPGLVYAIKSMKKKENSRFFIKWEVGFRELGCPARIEPKCDIIADIILISYDEIDTEENYLDLSVKEINRVDFQKSLIKAKELHLNGGDKFAKGSFVEAVNCYKKALRVLNNLRLGDDEQERLMLKCKLKCLVNMAVCYNKLGKYEQACLACQEALAIDYKNIKATFHYGKATLSLSNFKLSEELLLRANKLKPNDKDINRELKRLNDKKTLFEMSDKLFWKKAFENEEEEKEESEETLSHLSALEESLRSALEKCTIDKNPYVLPGKLLKNEIKLCKKIADSMNLHFETAGINVFQQKKS